MQSQQTFGRGGLQRLSRRRRTRRSHRARRGRNRVAKGVHRIRRDDERRLSALEPLVQANAEAIADDFYENVLHYEQTRAIVDRSPKDVDALKQTQQAYLVSLAAGEYDREFFMNRARIGKLHELLDMPLKRYVGQYGVYYDLILSRLNERVQQQVVDAIEVGRRARRRGRRRPRAVRRRAGTRWRRRGRGRRRPRGVVRGNRQRRHRRRHDGHPLAVADHQSRHAGRSRHVRRLVRTATRGVDRTPDATRPRGRSGRSGADCRTPRLERGGRSRTAPRRSASTPSHRRPASRGPRANSTT